MLPNRGRCAVCSPKRDAHLGRANHLVKTDQGEGAVTNRRLSGFALQEAKRVHALGALRRLRREARDEITRLIQFLDESDEYVMTEREEEADLEEVDDTEPSLGSFDRMMNQDKSWKQVHGETVAEIDAELDRADDEPSLGAPEQHPICPSSGHANRPGEFRDRSGDQSLWTIGATDEREDDPAEGGLADEDGLREQFDQVL
jgi:hypothetical protein